MGWEKNTPLGIRGEGILRPVEMVDFRKGKDTRGLGYEWGAEKTEEAVLPAEGEQRQAVVKIISQEESIVWGNPSSGQFTSQVER